MKLLPAGAACLPTLLLLIATSLSSSASAFRIAVFGGSGYVGRRVCEILVEAGCDVVSVSRSGCPPPYWASGSWVEGVDWVSADLLSLSTSSPPLLPNGKESIAGGDSDPDDDPLLSALGRIDGAVSLIGNVQPNPEWVSSSFFGLNFDDDRLRRENGVVNERACRLAEKAGAERFAFVSVSYEVAKALEGPIPGYLDGKRTAEHAAAALFGEDRTVVVGPSLVYGGKRFPAAGGFWRRVVASAPVRAYLTSQDFLRNLSTAPLEDWLEKMIFSPPVCVDSVARAVCAGVLGCIGKGVVGPRRQGFYDTNGKPVQYSDVIFVDGTEEIELVAEECGTLHILSDAVNAANKKEDEAERQRGASAVTVTQDRTRPVSTSSEDQGYAAPSKEPLFEGALIGMRPYLYPIPVIASLASIFVAIATGQFDALNEMYYNK